MSEVLKPFFPGDFKLVRVGEPPKNFTRTPSPAELDYLLLRAEGFSPKQIEERLRITEDASFSRRANAVNRLGTNGVSQAIAVCFDKGILSLDESIADSHRSLVGVNPYRLSGLEMASLRHKVLNLPDSDFPYRQSSISNGLAKMRLKMGLKAEAIPFGQALLYGYITTEEAGKAALTKTVNPHFTDNHRLSLELTALGLNPAERAANLPFGPKRALSILAEINLLLGTNSILESILVAARTNIISTADLAQRLTSDKPFSVDSFLSLLKEREKEVFNLIVRSKGVTSSKTELADALETTVGTVNSTFRGIKDKFGLGKIPALVVYLESLHQSRSMIAKDREQKKRERKLIEIQNQTDLEEMKQRAARRRLIVSQVENQHTL